MNYVAAALLAVSDAEAFSECGQTEVGGGRTALAIRQSLEDLLAVARRTLMKAHSGEELGSSGGV